MMKTKLLLFLFFPLTLFCQKNSNLEQQVLEQDFSKILMAQKFQIFDDEKKPEFVDRPEPLGYIGDDYERLYIHFLEIKKDPKNPKLYFAKGKTKVKDIIRDFSGTMEITNLKFKKDNDMYRGFTTGITDFKVKLSENKKLSATGIFTGNLISGFVVKDGKIYYDSLYFYADGFDNNTFIGNWKSYKTGKSKKVRFGDYRIPDSGDLDIGAGEFSPNFKYFDKGWKYYILKFSGDTEIDADLGRKKEAQKWWK